MQVASNLWQATRFSSSRRRRRLFGVNSFFFIIAWKNLAQEQKSRRLQKKTSIKHTTWMLLNMNILYVIICSKMLTMFPFMQTCINFSIDRNLIKFHLRSSWVSYLYFNELSQVFKALGKHVSRLKPSNSINAAKGALNDFLRLLTDSLLFRRGSWYIDLYVSPPTDNLSFLFRPVSPCIVCVYFKSKINRK